MKRKPILVIASLAGLGYVLPARADFTTDLLSRISEILTKMETSLANGLAARYGAIWTEWLDVPAAIRPENQLWQQALSGKADHQEAVRQTSEPLQPLPDLSALPEPVRTRLERRVARVERHDLINADTIHNRGAISLHAAQNDTKIRALEADVQSEHADSKHILVQLQLANLAHVQSLHIAQDTNKFLAVLSQLYLMLGQQQRDADAAAVNRELDQVNHALPLDRKLSTGISESISRFRLP